MIRVARRQTMPQPRVVVVQTQVRTPCHGGSARLSSPVVERGARLHRGNSLGPCPGCRWPMSFGRWCIQPIQAATCSDVVLPHGVRPLAEAPAPSPLARRGASHARDEPGRQDSACMLASPTTSTCEARKGGSVAVCGLSASVVMPAVIRHSPPLMPRCHQCGRSSQNGAHEEGKVCTIGWRVSRGAPHPLPARVMWVGETSRRGPRDRSNARQARNANIEKGGRPAAAQCSVESSVAAG